MSLKACVVITEGGYPASLYGKATIAFLDQADLNDAKEKLKGHCKFGEDSFLHRGEIRQLPVEELDVEGARLLRELKTVNKATETMRAISLELYALKAQDL